MPVNSKPTTAKSGKQKAKQPAIVRPGPLPDQVEFHQHIQNQMRTFVRTMLESTMREELDALLECQWGEHSPNRKGYRNGYYPRDLGTTTGPIEDLKVPRDREGQFQTKVFENYHRNEPTVEAGIRERFIAGVSTDKVAPVAEILTGLAPSKSAVSRINGELTQQMEEWRNRELKTHWLALYLEGVYLKVKYGDKGATTVVLTALGVDTEGNKQVLVLHSSAEESKEGWQQLLADLRKRGATQVDLVITDGNEGLIEALGETYSTTPRQRCLVHVQRSLSSHIPKGERQAVLEEFNAVWKQENKENALTQLTAFKAKYEKKYVEMLRSLAGCEANILTFYDFPAVLHKYIRTTNAIESLFSSMRKRTDEIAIFPNEVSCLTIVWAAISNIGLRPISL